MTQAITHPMGSEVVDGIALLSDLTETGKIAPVCIKILSISGPLRSRNGWAYRRMSVEDKSLAAEALVSEEKYEEWKFKKDDYLVCSIRSNGVGKDGKLTVFFNDFLGPFETAKMLFEIIEELHQIKSRSIDRMKSSETVYQISAREAKSLLELIKLWMTERKPQHYTKWCQMHQIVATNLYYMGLVKRTASMSGYYYPTQYALEFFEGKKDIPKKRVYVRDKDGRHFLASDEGKSRSFSEYLEDYTDRETALQEYRDALKAYQKDANTSNG